MWTHAAPEFRAGAFDALIWRVVESQSAVSTSKLVETLEAQSLLEDIIEASKPSLPPACRGMHVLLSTPFRYAPYPHSSRFRRAHEPEGCFYASDTVATAIAELAFYRLLFFLEAPGMTLPANALPHTAFAVRARTPRMIDLTAPPFDRDAALWSDPTRYAPCQDLADRARAAGIGLVRYRSVRDPACGMNAAVLAPDALVPPPAQLHTWRLIVRARAVQAFGDGAAPVEFPIELWRDDPRIAAVIGAG